MKNNFGPPKGNLITAAENWKFGMIMSFKNEVEKKMTKMHENELEIGEELVHMLLNSQTPQWANLPLKRISSSGTDNALYRLGSEYVVRLPRIDWATASIDTEYEWVPKIAKCLTHSISEPLFKGHAEDKYPWSWMITRWNEGQNPDFEHENEYNLLAKDLGDFLNELHGVKLANGPYSRRGVALKELDQETNEGISQLEGEIDIQAVTRLWRELRDIPYWQKDPLWVHGDFLPGNILTQNNRLSAVIDWSDLGVGDPACDLVIAWSLLNEDSRRIFKGSLVDIDENTWERGRGWALSIALIMLPYYKHSNPILATLARRMLANVLRD